ncbi:MAG: tyrosine-type recombinase/integrase [Syntrophales bacterium]|nr:tyrosine-type recombinase/integrase [Syntrophales bacterium]
MAELIKRGSISCQDCGFVRKERVCPKCGYDACMIRLSFKGKRYRIYHDKNGVPFSFSTAFQNLSQINKEIKDRTFSINDWLQPTIRENKFKNKYEVWIKQKTIEAEAGRFSLETLKLYKSYKKNHYGPLYALDVREIELSHLQELVNGLGGYAEKYVKNLVDCLKTFFKWLNRWERVRLPIFPEVEITTGDARQAILYEEQIKAIERFPAAHHDILFFIRETGLRVSEGCAIQIRDLDLPGGRALIQRTYSGYRLVEKTKGKNKKWIPLSDVALDIAQKHAEGRFGAEFLFINPSTGRGYKAAYLRDLWAAYGIKGLTLYEATRHSTISDWSRNASAFQVKDLARHSDIRTSQQYVHNAMTDLKKIVNRGKVISIRTGNVPEAENE